MLLFSPFNEFLSQEAQYRTLNPQAPDIPDPKMRPSLPHGAFIQTISSVRRGGTLQAHRGHRAPLPGPSLGHAASTPECSNRASHGGNIGESNLGDVLQNDNLLS